MSTLEIISTVLSLIYIVLAVNNKSICFVFGLVASLFWGYVSMFSYNLLFDAILQIFYMGMSLYGLYLWRSRSGEDKAEELCATLARVDVAENYLQMNIKQLSKLDVIHVSEQYDAM